MFFHDLLATRSRQSVDVLGRSLFQSSVMVGACRYLIPTAPKTNLIEPEGSPIFFKEETSKPSQTLHFWVVFFPNVICFMLYPRWIFQPQKMDSMELRVCSRLHEAKQQSNDRVRGMAYEYGSMPLL